MWILFHIIHIVHVAWRIDLVIQVNALEKLRYAAELENIAPMLKNTREFLQDSGFSDGKAAQIELAVDELLVNIISYAYPEKKGDIELSFSIDNATLIIRIVDWGVPFDPLIIEEPDTQASVEDRPIGGLGILFVRKIMDDVHYHREDERNVLALSVAKK